MVNVKADPGRIPFPRRLSLGELGRFYDELEADLRACGAYCPSWTRFRTKYKFDRTYDSFKEAMEQYERIVENLCRGEEPEIPE